MKLKLDDQGHVVVKDGRPVYVHDDGKELAFDAPGTVATITRLNGEAKSHRERAEAAEGKLKGFEGIEDAEAARKALETVSNLDAGKLLTAGKVEEIKAAAQKAAQDQLAAASKTHAAELQKIKDENAQLTTTLNGEMIGGSFNRSKLIAEKFAIPADLVQARFGKHFKVEGGKLVAYDSSGNQVFSRTRHGEVADFDEALETLVDQYPYKDHILKGAVAGGGGAGQGGGGAVGGKTIKRAAFDQLSPADKAAKMKERVAVVD